MHHSVHSSPWGTADSLQCTLPLHPLRIEDLAARAVASCDVMRCVMLKLWIYRYIRYWGMAINPLTGMYMPIRAARIPTVGWMTIHIPHYTAYIYHHIPCFDYGTGVGTAWQLKSLALNLSGWSLDVYGCLWMSVVTPIFTGLINKIGCWSALNVGRSEELCKFIIEWASALVPPTPLFVGPLERGREGEREGERERER